MYNLSKDIDMLNVLYDRRCRWYLIFLVYYKRPCVKLHLAFLAQRAPEQW